MKIHEFTLELAEQYREAREAYFKCTEADEQLNARKIKFFDAAQRLASSLLDDIDKAKARP